MLRHQKSVFDKFLKLCTLLNVDPLTLVDYHQVDSDVETEKKSFSLSKLYSLREQWENSGRPVHSSLGECADVIQGWVNRRESRTVCAANFQVLMEVHRNEYFAQDLLENIDFVTTHSLTVEWTLNQRGIHFPRPIFTAELLQVLCDYCDDNRKSIFLLGNRQHVLDKVYAKLTQNFPGLNVIGAHHICLPTDPANLTVDREVIQIINQSGANLVLISLPQPIQEIWLSKHRHEMQTVLFGVGSTFQYYTEPNKLPPAFLQRLRIVWLFFCCLAQTPYDFWNHYLFNLPAFIWLMLKNWFDSLQSQYSPPISDDVRRVRALLERIHVLSY